MRGIVRMPAVGVLLGVLVGGGGCVSILPDKDFARLPFDQRVQQIVGVWEGRVADKSRIYVIHDVQRLGNRWFATIEHDERAGGWFMQEAKDRDGTVYLNWIGMGNTEITFVFPNPRILTVNFKGTTSAGKAYDVTGWLEKTSTLAAVRSQSPSVRPAVEPAPALASPQPPVISAPEPSQRRQTLVQPYPNSWAVVIGINAYDKVSPKLKYAVADARAVAEALPTLGFPRENIRVLLDGEATRSRIEQVLYREFAKMGSDDRLLVYFAGHGETTPVRGGEEGFILPVDSDPDALPLTAIPMDEIRRIGQRVKAKHSLFVFDACFSGFAIVRDTVPAAVTDEVVAAALREPVVQVITAGRKGEQAIEERGHGLFTRRLLEGLRGLADPEGRGVITAGQLAAWLETQVVRDSKGRMSPQYGRLDGEGQFLFVKSSQMAAAPSAATPPATPRPLAGAIRAEDVASLAGTWAGESRVPGRGPVAITTTIKPDGTFITVGPATATQGRLWKGDDGKIHYESGVSTGTMTLQEESGKRILRWQGVARDGRGPVVIEISQPK